jgi:twitching motility protein PilT
LSTSEKLLAILARCAALEASDVHLGVGEPIVWRVDGDLVREGAPLDDEHVTTLVASALTAKHRETLEREGSVDLALDASGFRFRVNVFRARGHYAIAARKLEEKMRSLAELNLPHALGTLADLRDGLVLVTGPTGSGKTTTLATLLDAIHSKRPCHILTIEDPVEYVHRSALGLVRQREVNTDVPSFAAGLRSALREDPDVILIGEMRDVETIRAAVMAAETGHLVYSTLHSGDTVGAIDRLIGALPSDEQPTVRHQLSMVLRAVVSQRLLKRADGKGRVPAVEILLVTTAVQNLIRTNRSQGIYSAIEAGTAHGMQTFERSLADLVARGKAHAAEARSLTRDEKSFDERLRVLRGKGGSP